MTHREPTLDPERLLAQADWVRALARRLVSDVHAAEDLAQDALVVALECPPRAGSDIAGLRAFLAATVRNLARLSFRSAARRRAREERTARPERLPSAATTVARATQVHRVVEAVLALDEPYRAAVLLRYFDGLTAAQIAERENTTPAAVRQRLSRGLSTLRARLEREIGADWRHALLPLAAAPLAPSNVPTSLAVGSGVGTGMMKAGAVVLVLAILCGGALLVEKFVSPSTSGSAPSSVAPPLVVTGDEGEDRVGATGVVGNHRRTAAVDTNAPHDPSDRGSTLFVVDEQGSAVPGARLIVEGEDVVLEADDDGRIGSVSREVQGRTVLAYSPGFALTSHRIRAGDQEVALARRAGIPLQIVWRDTRQPIQGAEVSLHGRGEKWTSSIPRLLSLRYRTDSDGRLNMPAVGIGATVEVSTPDGLSTLMSYGFLRSLIAPIERQEAVVPIDRDAPTLQLRFLDEESAPLRGLPVTIEAWYRSFAMTTDDEGSVRLRVSPTAGDSRHLEFDAVLELDADRRWAAYESFDLDERVPHFTHRVRHRPVEVRIGGPAPEAFEVAAACVPKYFLEKARRDGDFPSIHPSAIGLEDLRWMPVASGGSIRLSQGWRGRHTVIMLRHRESGRCISWTEVDESDRAILTVPSLCRLTLRSSAADPALGLTLELERCRPDGGGLSRLYPDSPLTMPLSELPTTIVVPAGYYRPDLGPYGCNHPLGLIDAREATADHLLELPPLREVSGIVRGQLSGPLARVGVNARVNGAHVRGGGRTNRDGRFRFSVLGEEPDPLNFLWADWEGHYQYMWVMMSDGPVDIVRPEARVVVRLDPSTPLFREHPIRIRYQGSAGWTTHGRRALDLEEEWQAILPPGPCVIRQTVGGIDIFEASIDLAPGEARPIVVSTGDYCPLKIQLLHDLENDVHLELTALDDAGESVVGRRNLISRATFGARESTESTHIFPLPPGDYDLRLEGAVWIPTGRDMFDDRWEEREFRWSGRATCRPGCVETVTVEVFPR